MERLVLIGVEMTSFNAVHKNSRGISDFYYSAVTIPFRTRKGVQYFVKYVNNFAHMVACN